MTIESSKTMKWLKLLSILLILSVWIYLLNTSFGNIPPIGKFFNPFGGFWQNAEPLVFSLKEQERLKGLYQHVTVHFDERRVPHVFAQNEHDLYYMQGYLVARDRLWQMEFISYAASGRISELVGDKALNFDRTNRRMGLPWSATKAIAHLNDNPEMKLVLEAYAEGVNAYIASLNERNMPLEYKLLNYQPQKWEPYQSALLLKYMAKMLASQETDFELTNALKLFGKEIVDLLYPDFPAGIDPIHPAGTRYDFPKDTFKQQQPLVPDFLLATLEHMKPQDAFLGSNNWAVGGHKTKSGRPILCNDPHLQLQLPSIWYEMQLATPEVNTYGVTIPGAPCIIIGFNNHISWGVTNAGMDVKDWYAIQYKDATRDSYLYDHKYLPTKKIVEAIKIRNKGIFYDTVVYTHHGPVMFDENFPNGKITHPMAMRWTAHTSYQEIMTFYLLNRAKNYDDYLKAISYFECPAQNFVFASKTGDIAICEMGTFPLKYFEQGKFLSDGTASRFEWKGFIPHEHIPVTKNPERGFVSSANQHPFDSTYPHYYNTGYGYEYYRNRSINNRLAAMHHITPQDMMQLQNDNFNLHASEILPYLLTLIDRNQLSKEEDDALTMLMNWNYYNEADLVAPSYFSAFWDTLYNLLWDEFTNGYTDDEKEIAYILKKPNHYITVDFLINHPHHPFIDHKQTSEKENLNMLVNKAFKAAVAVLKNLENKNWASYQNTFIGHYALISAFNVPVYTGGYKYAINAISKQHGPSWRMVVSMEDPIRAWGNYPGGQSGNPGSSYYTSQILSWSKGEYYELIFLQNANDKRNIKQTQNFIPSN
jgi:penicillin amidase